MVLFILLGLLPPFAQSVRELHEVLTGLQDIPAGEMIEAVERTEQGYQVITSHYIVQVEMEYLPRQQIGPMPFQLHFSELVHR